MNKKKILSIVTLFALFQGTHAQTFTESGWTYTVISSSSLTVRVIGRYGGWTATADIPSAVVHNGILFSVTEIGNNIWNDGSISYINVTAVNIPNSILSIGDSAFVAFHNLANITFNSSTPPIIGTDAFKGQIPLYAFVHVPCGATINYANNPQLNHFSHFVEEGMYGTVILQQTSGGTITMTQEPTCSTPAIIEAIPATTYSFPAYDFVSWSDGDTNNPRTLYVRSDTVISAIFTPHQFYNIAEVFDSTQGYAVGDTAYYGDMSSFTAYPYHGYTFSEWKAYNSSTHQWFTFSNENPYYRVMDYSLRLRAEFTPAQYTVTVQSDGGGTVNVGSSGNNTGSFNYLSSAYVYATPSTGYRFVMWSDSNEFASRYITVRGDTTLSAVFASIESLRDTIYDTIYVHDTTVVNRTDTLWLHDTITIHDTVYITQEGIDGVDTLNAKVYSSQGQIVVEGADGNTVTLYDLNGRILASKQDYGTVIRFDAPASGTFMIKIGNHAARKVVVIR